MYSALPGLEIERKFLVASDEWRDACRGTRRIRQSYLPYAPGVSMRVRMADQDAILSFKTDLAEAVRSEWEVPIPTEMADWLFSLCPHPPIEKIRHLVDVDDHLFEVDLFLGRHEGLILAEIELNHPDQNFPKPLWLGQEVTSDKKYRNSQLYRMPKPMFKPQPVPVVPKRVRQTLSS